LNGYFWGGLLRWLGADGELPGAGGLDVIVASDLLQGKTRGWSEKKRKREGKGRSKKSAALAHGFIVQGSIWPRYWAFSGEESPWIDGGSRKRKEGKRRGDNGKDEGAVRGPFWSRE
jgi:hypothetical protein